MIHFVDEVITLQGVHSIIVYKEEKCNGKKIAHPSYAT